MAKGDCTQSDAQRLEPISETESEREDERCDAKASPVKHGSPTAEERSWSPTVVEYTRCLVHGSITRLAELKDRWNEELGVFTELDKDDLVQFLLRGTFSARPSVAPCFYRKRCKGSGTDPLGLSNRVPAVVRDRVHGVQLHGTAGGVSFLGPEKPQLQSPTQRGKQVVRGCPERMPASSNPKAILHGSHRKTQ